MLNIAGLEEEARHASGAGFCFRHGPYLNLKRIHSDPWGHAYVYSQPGSSGHPHTITCAAPDGTIYISDR